jgi:hypothetical protein
MTRPALFTATLLLLFGFDNPQSLPWRAASAPDPTLLNGFTLPVMPLFAPSSPSTPPAPPVQQQQASAKPATPPSDDAKKDSPLDPFERLDLVRYVDGEFAHARTSLPPGKDGFILRAGKPLDEQLLQRALAIRGASINSGDKVQITDIQFKEKQIIFALNGGGRPKTHWLHDHLQIETAGIPSMSTTSNTPGEPQKIGSTLILDFGRNVPAMTPDELKGLLTPVLDFTKQRSAAVQWVDSLPPEMQKAIAEKRAAMGMSHEMVIAAVGKPDKKVRETAADGTETEDWIYGTPPAKTLFVTFTADKVVRIEQFPR